jgi:hypothetical protein
MSGQSGLATGRETDRAQTVVPVRAIENAQESNRTVDGCNTPPPAPELSAYVNPWGGGRGSRELRRKPREGNDSSDELERLAGREKL